MTNVTSRWPRLTKIDQASFITSFPRKPSSFAAHRDWRCKAFAHEFSRHKSQGRKAQRWIPMLIVYISSLVPNPCWLGIEKHQATVQLGVEIYTWFTMVYQWRQNRPWHNLWVLSFKIGTKSSVASPGCQPEPPRNAAFWCLVTRFNAMTGFATQPILQIL